MADSLETLFKNLGPTTAAMWAGEREALNNYASEANTAHQQQQIQDLLQKHAQNEIMNPLEVQKLRLGNQGLEAGLSGIGADSRRKVMEADTYGATQASNIAKTNSSNEYEVLNNNIKQNDALVDILGKGAESLKQLPPAARHAAAYQQLFKMGGQGAVDAWKDKINSVSGEKLPDVIGALAQHSAMGSVGMRQELEKLRIQGEKAKDVARIGADASKYATDQRRDTAEAKAEASKTKADTVKGLEQQVAQNLENARKETDSEKAAMYYAQAAQSAKLKAEITKYGTADIGTVGGIATNPISPLGPANSTGKNLTPAQKRAELEALTRK